MEESWINECICNNCAFRFEQKMGGFSIENNNDDIPIIDEDKRIICGIATNIISDVNLYVLECMQHKTQEEIIKMQQIQAQMQAQQTQGNITPKTTASGLHLV